MKTFKQFQEEKKFGPDGKPISKKDDLLKRMSKGYDKNVKGKLKDLESKARKPTQSPDGSYEVKFNKDGTPYTKPSAPDAKTGADRIDDKYGSNMRKTKGQTYTKVPKSNTKSKTYGSKKDYRTRTPSEMTRDFKRGIDNYVGEDPLRKRTGINTKSRRARKNFKDILKNAFGNKNKVKNPITKIGKTTMKIPKKPTVISKSLSKASKVLSKAGTPGKIAAAGLVATGVAYANRDKIGNLLNRIRGKTPVYTGGYGKGNKGLPAGSEGKPTHKMKQMYIKGVPKARVDKKGSAQVSKPRKGSWNDRQLKEGAMAIPAAAAVGKYVVPALMTGIGAAGTIMQSKKKDKDVNITPRGLKNLENAVFRGKTGRKLDAEILKRREQKEKMKGVINPKKGEVEKTKKLIDVYKKTGKKIKPKEGEVTKQRELVSKAEKQITKPKSGEKKDASKTVKDFLKARKIEGKTMMKNKEDMEILKKGPGDLVPKARKTYLDKLLRNLRKEEVAIANSMGGGGIAGSVEAGDEPPIKKKKKTYAYGGRGSRKMWMNNK